MKKITWILLAVLVVMVAVSAAFGTGAPTIANVEPTMALQEDGTILTVENKMVASYIYVTDPDGTLQFMHKEIRKLKDNSYIALVAGNGHEVSFIRAIVPDKGKSTYEICSLDMTTHDSKTLGTVEEAGTLAGLSVEKDAIYACFLNSGAVSVYSVPLTVKEDSGAGAAEAAEPVETPKAAPVYSETRTGSDTVIGAWYDGMRLYSLLADGRVRRSGSDPTAYLSAGGSAAYAEASMTAMNLWMADGQYGFTFLGTVLGSVNTEITFSGTPMAGAALDDKNMTILSKSGEKIRVTTTREDVTSSFDKITGKGTVMLSVRMPSLLLTLLMTLLVLLIIWIGAFLCMRSGKMLTRVLTITCIGMLLLFLILMGAMASWYLKALGGERLSIADVLDYVSIGLMPAILMGLVVVVVCFAITMLLVRRITEPLNEVADRMELVAQGNMRPAPVKTGDDEVGRLWKSIRTMCASLAIRDYETQSMITSIHRFVPQGLLEILNRANVAEVDFGDINTREGCMEIVSASNRAQARLLLEDKPFMDYVNACYSAIETTAVASRGMMVDSGSNLGKIIAVFPGGARDAQEAALALLGEQGKRRGTVMPEYGVLLHKGSFLYGVAGNDRHVFPFLSSAEIEFLSAQADRLAGLGVKAAATDCFLMQTDNKQNTRYIGFVTSPDERHVFKIYELLMSYPDSVRNQRLACDEKLQEGISLFYKNDFYLARNLFSAVLRACPDDGVARWYLFACEHYFNAVDEEPVYRLFSIDE